jgi:hypothetical protein
LKKIATFGMHSHVLQRSWIMLMSACPNQIQSPPKNMCGLNFQKAETQSFGQKMAPKLFMQRRTTTTPAQVVPTHTNACPNRRITAVSIKQRLQSEMYKKPEMR